MKEQPGESRNVEAGARHGRAGDADHGGERLYAKLARTIREEIAAGKYPVGSLLPGELELAAQHGISRQTAREALRLLTGEGLLVRRRGIGTSVRQSAAGARYVASVSSFQELEQYARHVELAIRRIDHVKVSRRLAGFLRCREGTSWLLISGIRHMRNTDDPVAFSETYVRDDFPDLEKKLAKLPGTALHILLEREYGAMIHRIHQETHATALPSELAEHLDCEAGTPCLEIRRWFYGAGGRLIAAGHAVFKSADYHYSTDFVREDRTGAKEF